VAWGRAYLNYLLVLAGLSRHVERPPRRFLELGGGFGVLGEIVLSRDPSASYVDLDIPPLVTVASYYLTELFGDRRVITALDVPAGEVSLEGRSAVLPSWRMPDVRGTFDVFVNSYSFQEMEPDVVANYARLVASLGVEWVVSLNSAAGKQRASAAGEFGALDPVTSASIVGFFESHGYAVEGRYRSPLLNSWGELVVLRRPRTT
jgi:putative sugar O-methyltransferase